MKARAGELKMLPVSHTPRQNMSIKIESEIRSLRFIQAEHRQGIGPELQRQV
jgi:hypothetical protein